MAVMHASAMCDVPAIALEKDAVAAINKIAQVVNVNRKHAVRHPPYSVARMPECHSLCSLIAA
jgi:hypothetical protein